MRRLIKLRRGPAKPACEAKDGLFSPAGLAEATRLERTFALEGWRLDSGRLEYRTSLFYAAMVEAALIHARLRLPHTLRVLDAGAGDWFYVRALHGLLSRYDTQAPRQVELDGLELDAWALYKGFRSRHDWAETYLGNTPGCRYLPGDLLAYTREVDLSLMLFPFIFAPELRQWGLPDRFLRPETNLAHVWSLVRPGGALIIANSGEAEHVEQLRMMSSLGIPASWSARFESPLAQYPTHRFVTISKKGRKS